MTSKRHSIIRTQSSADYQAYAVIYWSLLLISYDSCRKFVYFCELSDLKLYAKLQFLCEFSNCWRKLYQLDVWIVKRMNHNLDDGFNSSPAWYLTLNKGRSQNINGQNEKADFVWMQYDSKKWLNTEQSKSDEAHVLPIYILMFLAQQQLIFLWGNSKVVNLRVDWFIDIFKMLFLLKNITHKKYAILMKLAYFWLNLINWPFWWLNLLATNVWWTILNRNNSRFSFNFIQSRECLTHTYVVY